MTPQNKVCVVGRKRTHSNEIKISYYNNCSEFMTDNEMISIYNIYVKTSYRQEIPRILYGPEKVLTQ